MKDASDEGQELVLSQIILKCAQFAMEAMLGVIDLEPILENELRFLGGSAQIPYACQRRSKAKAALARRSRQFSSSLIRFLTSGADVCALT